jgi:hypothetical protein
MRQGLRGKFMIAGTRDLRNPRRTFSAVLGHGSFGAIDVGVDWFLEI